jgi:glycosyltransferase involved in cell wall biosynthesis
MKKISCIIPAYNEGARIGAVLSVVVPCIGKELFEVIVVDDGSRDSTKEAVKTFPEVRLIEHSVNGGKSKTVADGIAASTGDYIFLLDADLKFLSRQNITDLVRPIMENLAEVSISYRKNAWPLFPFKKIDYLSGERILPKTPLLPSLPAMSKLPSYGLEVFLNRIIIRNKMSISVVKWPLVENCFNQYKYGWAKGIVIIAGIWWNVLSTVSIFEMYSQNFKMRKLLVL